MDWVAADDYFSDYSFGSGSSHSSSSGWGSSSGYSYSELTAAIPTEEAHEAVESFINEFFGGFDSSCSSCSSCDGSGALNLACEEEMALAARASVEQQSFNIYHAGAAGAAVALSVIGYVAYNKYNKYAMKKKEQVADEFEFVL